MRVLFLCVGNSCRSQMAEGLLNKMGKGEFQSYSAGSKPEKEVNRYATNVMAELSIDISSKKPKHINEFNNQSFEYVFTMCGKEGEICPVFLGQAKHYIHKPFDDPALFKGTEEETLEYYREIRDKIKNMLAEYFKLI
ncbi:arsenate reductase ArsC [candidate division WOR-3 bacterium]|nr:arsenate reductase ArsC [candidate division WOR-3 bacterium]